MVPFQTGVSVQIPNNGNTAEVKVTTIPAKRRLVIEYVSCDIQLPTGQRPFVFIATNVLGSGALIHRLFAEFQATFGPADFFVVSQLTRLYADAGTDVIFGIQRSAVLSPIQSGANVTISGYLEDAV